MKWNVTLSLFLTISLISWQTKKSTSINLNTFSSIPKNMEGAGESFYLSAKDKKEGKFICTTNYMDALIYLNQKPITLKTKDAVNFPRTKQIFTSEKYALIIIKVTSKKVGDENYTLKGILTLKYNSNVIWQKSVVGEGGD